MTEAFPMVELAVKEILEARVAGAEDVVGGDLAYDGSTDFYIWIGLIGGSTDLLEGEWIVDIDVFSRSYGTAMSKALEIEAKIIGPRHVTETMRLDNVYQNQGPAERPWDDDTVYRIGSTYVFTARRSG